MKTTAIAILSVLMGGCVAPVASLESSEATAEPLEVAPSAETTKQGEEQAACPEPHGPGGPVGQASTTLVRRPECHATPKQYGDCRAANPTALTVIACPSDTIKARGLWPLVATSGQQAAAQLKDQVENAAVSKANFEACGVNDCWEWVTAGCFFAIGAYPSSGGSCSEVSPGCYACD